MVPFLPFQVRIEQPSKAAHQVIEPQLLVQHVNQLTQSKCISLPARLHLPKNVSGDLRSDPFNGKEQPALLGPCEKPLLVLISGYL